MYIRERIAVISTSPLQWNLFNTEIKMITSEGDAVQRLDEGRKSGISEIMLE